MTERYDVELILPDGETARVEVRADESVWDAATRAGIKLPSMCLQGWCTTCSGRVLEGELEHAEAPAMAIAQSERWHRRWMRPTAFVAARAIRLFSAPPRAARFSRPMGEFLERVRSREGSRP
jgi:ferredoxin